MKDDFNSRFGLNKLNSEELKRQFINRVNSHLFKWLEDDGSLGRSDFVSWISLESGEPWDKEFPKNHSGEYYNIRLEKISSSDFLKILWLIERCYYFIKNGKLRTVDRRFIIDYSKIITLQNFNQRIEDILLRSNSEIGIFWKEEKFYKAGAEELDEALIKDNLEWLNDFPEVKLQYNSALDHFKDSIEKIPARKDAITNAYSSIERLSQIILDNKNNFDKNSDKLVEYLKLPKEYKRMIHSYKEIANEYSSRHAGSEFSHIETEAFIYMTGLIIRLIAQKNT